MHLKPVFSSLDSYLIAKEIIATWEKSTQLFTKDFKVRQLTSEKSKANNVENKGIKNILIRTIEKKCQ